MLWALAVLVEEFLSNHGAMKALLRNKHQKYFGRITKEIYSMSNLLLHFDKTGNLYKLNIDYYFQLLRKEIHKNCRIIHNSALRKANLEPKFIMVTDLHKMT